MNFTKGEWKLISTGEHIDTIYGIGLDNHHAIATVNRKQFPNEAEANAHLIAAAPDMYNILHSLINDPDHFCLLPPHWKNEISRALAKAEGK